jgi:hypothetical protein
MARGRGHRDRRDGRRRAPRARPQTARTFPVRCPSGRWSHAAGSTCVQPAVSCESWVDVVVRAGQGRSRARFRFDQTRDRPRQGVSCRPGESGHALRLVPEHGTRPFSDSARPWQGEDRRTRRVPSLPHRCGQSQIRILEAGRWWQREEKERAGPAGEAQAASWSRPGRNGPTVRAAPGHCRRRAAGEGAGIWSALWKLAGGNLARSTLTSVCRSCCIAKLRIGDRRRIELGIRHHMTS